MCLIIVVHRTRIIVVTEIYTTLIQKNKKQALSQIRIMIISKNELCRLLKLSFGIVFPVSGFFFSSSLGKQY